MEVDKVNPKFQPHNPLPTWQEDGAPGRQCMGAEGSSVLPLLETEEWALDKEKDNEDQELSQWGNIGGQELCLWEEVRAQELY